MVEKNNSRPVTPDTQPIDDFDMDSVSAVGSLAGSKSWDGSTEGASPSSQPPNKKRKHGQTASSESSDFLRELFANRQRATDFLSQRPRDDLQSFFDYMCDTVRKFSPLEIAKIKFEIAQIVGKQEILWAENAANQTLQIIANRSIAEKNSK